MLNIILYFLSSTVVIYLNIIIFLIMARVMHNLFFGGAEESRFAVFLYTSTEPLMMPVRNALSRVDFFQSFPIDFTAMATVLTVYLVMIALSVF